MRRFTFVVCAVCGVQSQPILIDDDYAAEITAPLGWKVDKLRLTTVATCPQCLDNAQKQAV